MNSDIKKLLRLIEIHSKLVENQSDSVREYAVSISACDERMNGVLASLELHEKIGLPLTKAVSTKMREICDTKIRLQREIALAKVEKDRLNGIIDELQARSKMVAAMHDEEENAGIIEEWLQIRVNES